MPLLGTDPVNFGGLNYNAIERPAIAEVQTNRDEDDVVSQLRFDGAAS